MTSRKLHPKSIKILHSESWKTHESVTMFVFVPWFIKQLRAVWDRTWYTAFYNILEFNTPYIHQCTSERSTFFYVCYACIHTGISIYAKDWILYDVLCFQNYISFLCNVILFFLTAYYLLETKCSIVIWVQQCNSL